MPGLVVDWHWSENAAEEEGGGAEEEEGYTHAVIVYLRSKADLRRYLAHPECAAVQKMQADLVEATLTTDLVMPPAPSKF